MHAFLGRIVALAVALAWGGAWAGGGMSQADAFAAGNASAATTANFDAINAGNAANALPNYSTTAPAAGYFAGGNGDLTTPGMANKADCIAGTSSTDPGQIQSCNAVRFLNDAPGVTPPLGLTYSDPLLATAKTVRGTPQTYADDLGASYSACTSTSTVTPGSTTYETCHEYLSVAGNTCQVNRVIVVDVYRTYDCLTQDMTIQHLTCQRTNVVTVDVTDSCLLMNQIAYASLLYPGGEDSAQVRALCDWPNDGGATVRIQTKWGAWGGWVNVDVPKTGAPVRKDLGSQLACTPSCPSGGSPVEAFLQPGGGCDPVTNACAYSVWYGNYVAPYLDWCGWGTDGAMTEMCWYGGYWIDYGTVTLNFSMPHHIYTAHENWDDGCSSLEAAAK